MSHLPTNSAVNLMAHINTDEPQIIASATRKEKGADIILFRLYGDNV